MITEREAILAHLLNETCGEGQSVYRNFDMAIDLCHEIRDAWAEGEIGYTERQSRRLQYERWESQLRQLEQKL